MKVIYYQFTFPRVYPAPFEIPVEPPHEPVLLPLAPLGVERSSMAGQHVAIDGEIDLAVAGPQVVLLVRLKIRAVRPQGVGHGAATGARRRSSRSRWLWWRWPATVQSRY